MESPLKFCSANCQGLGSKKPEKRRDVMKYLRSKGFDIYFLQDTHFEPSIEQMVRNEWGYECFFSSYTSRARGVAICFNNTFEYKLINVINDPNGNFIVVKLKINLSDYVLINLYAPNKDDPIFFQNIYTLLSNINLNNIIIGGDWNLVLNPAVDSSNYKHINNIKSKIEVDNLIMNFNLTDIFRQVNPTVKKYTWHKKTNSKIVQQGRLDFFLVSDHLINRYSRSQIIPGYRSDHSIMTIELKTCPTTKKSRTFWKFNNQLLKDPEYIKVVKETIKKTKLEYMSLVYNKDSICETESYQPRICDQLFFEVLIMEIRSSTLRFAAKKKREENNIESELIKDIERLEENKALNEAEIVTKKESLENIRKKKLMGSLIRSRANWIENGEKPTKYFCKLESRHYTNKRMTKLIDKHGRELLKDDEIIQETKLFYENLYKSHQDILEKFENSNAAKLVDRKLTDCEAEELEGPIQIEELSNCLKNMKNNKSPGSDGFSVEFFKFFWKDIKHILLNSLNISFQKRELSNTQKEGVITCIPKGEKPREFLKNWRPICLLNVAYKLCSGCIAARLKKVLPIIISGDQTGFMKNRFVGDNIRFIYDAMHHIKANNKEGLLLLIDFEKAFDTLSWEFIQDTLTVFNFKNDIKKWISIFFRNIKSCVVVNNKVSSWFDINRGFRQGDPISPYIFVICAEILAIMIRKNEKIKGIRIGSDELKISQYADDTSLLLDGSKDSFEYCIHTILEYAKYSGLNMNFEKTKVITLGNTRNDIRYMPNLDLEWNPKTFTVLGIEFNKKLQNLLYINLNRKVNEINSLIKVWSKRNLTPLGRITVLKSLIIAKITHIMMTLPPENCKIIDDLEKRFFKFIWGGKPDPIKRSNAYEKASNGGINMINLKFFQQSLRITWIRRLFGESKSPWKNIVFNDCNPIKSIIFYGSSYCDVCMRSTSNNFWKTVLNDYKIYCNNYDKNNKDQFLSQPIFYNPKFKISPELIGTKKLIESQIFTVHQVLERDECTLLSSGQLKRKYDIQIDFIYLKHIETALRKHNLYGKYQGSVHNNSNVTCYYQNICKNEKGTKNIYDSLLTKSDNTKIIEKWKNFGLENIEWKDAYKVVDKSIDCTKLKWFQFRIINQIITTNKSVSKFKENQSPLCTFCKTTDEDIAHLFYDCQKVNFFWKELERKVQSKCTHILSGNIPRQLILIGTAPNFYSNPIFDLILVMAKHHIYYQKVKGELPAIEIFMHDLKTRYLIDKNTDILQNSKSHELKWRDFKPLFSDYL